MRNNKLCVTLLSLILLFSLWLMVPTRVQADSTPLSVKALLPENQFNKEVSYYHLLMEPGATQEIELQLFNSSKEETVAIVELTAATTNNNGVIDYNLPNKERDKSLLYPFPTIAKTPQEVKIPANSDVTTKIQIQMPFEEYDGMILGGVNVRAKKAQTEEKTESKGGMKIENEMNYAIAVVLVENETLVKTDLALEKVFASQLMGNNTTRATLQNPTSAVIEELTIEAKVTKKGSDKILYQTKQERYRMAPNSSFDFGIPLGNERYEAGDYHLNLVAVSDPTKSEDGERQVWEFNKDFQVKRKEAEKLNKTAIDLPKDYRLYYLVGGIVGAVALLLIVTLIIFRKKKRREIEISNEKRKSPNKKRRRKKNTSND